MNERLMRALLPGEHLLWEGAPSTGLILRPIDIFLIPFSLFWGGFALYWNIGVWSFPGDGPDLAFRLFGLPFLAIGLYVTVGRFLVDIWLRGHLRYAVTDQRILILRTVGNSTRSLDIRRLPMIELEERSDGSGTIHFDTEDSLFMSGGYGVWQPTASRAPQFIRIGDVRHVYDLIQRQQG